MTVTGWCNLILLGIVACGAAASGAADDSTAVPVSGRQAAVEVALPALAELLEYRATKSVRNRPTG